MSTNSPARCAANRIACYTGADPYGAAARMYGGGRLFTRSGFFGYTVPMKLESSFPRYTDFDPKVPIYCATPDMAGCLHRFFDTSPISPSGRFLGVTRFRDETRLPAMDESADIVVVDLDTGEQKIIATTKGFGTQLGAQVQWGATDHDLFYNDQDHSERIPVPYGVHFDPIEGKSRRLEGPIYMVSPDGKKAVSPCLLRTSLAQPGYGTQVLPTYVPQNRGASRTDGIYMTEIDSGKSRLLISYAEIFEAISDSPGADELAERDLYGFHLKWNSSGDRLLFVVRGRAPDPSERLLNFIVTIDSDGSNPRMALSHVDWKRGHHPNWCPDGRNVLMNLKLDAPELRFVRFSCDGGPIEVLSEIEGGGHPTLHPDGRHILTDEYEHGPLANPDGTTPMRMIDLQPDEEIRFARIRTRPDYHGPARELRVDPHPAWDPSFRYIAFNACPDGKRRVYIADMEPLL